MSAPTNGDTAKLTMPDGKSIELPVLRDHAGQTFLDISLLQRQGVITYDPGLTSTAMCASSITYIDGEKGQLMYRGYDIADLVEKSDFYDCSFLLLHGELPTSAQKAAWKRNISQEMLVHESLVTFIKAFRHDAHPMGILCGVVGALSAFFPEFSNIHDPVVREKACLKMISVMPTLAAYSYKCSIGEPIVYPRSELSWIENFLYMMFSRPTENFVVDPVLCRALERVIIAQMDHEQNASTSTVRTSGSSQSNPFACISSGIGSLWGPAHGGASEAVIKMLEEISTVDRIPIYIAKAKDKSDPFRLMGFGHRIYKTYDPRAHIMRKTCYEVLDHLGICHDPLLEVALELEKAALSDPYFQQRALYPNTDFFSGLVLRAMDIPLSMFTVVFTLSRTTGWLSQWREMVAEQPQKIVRPRQMYTGVGQRQYVEEAQRTEDRAAPWQESEELRQKNLRREAARKAHESLSKGTSQPKGMSIRTREHVIYT